MMAHLRTSPNSPAGRLAADLGGKRCGRGWVARCPAHADNDPSLSISEGDHAEIIFHCFAGCDPPTIISILRQRGLWDGEQRNTRPTAEQIERRKRDDAQRAAERIEQVTAIWNEATDPRGTVAVDYLNSRKLILPDELCGSVLRFHPRCPWEGDYVPCLVAAFTSIADDSVKAIHRIRLDQPERWPKAERKMFGPVAGTAVKLDPVGTSLVIGEGVETCLAARQLGMTPAWALGSSSNIKTFAPVAGVNELTILGENDNGTNQQAAEACREKWKGCRVTILKPRRTTMKDMNDLLMENENAQTSSCHTVEPR